MAEQAIVLTPPSALQVARGDDLPRSIGAVMSAQANGNSAMFKARTR